MNSSGHRLLLCHKTDCEHLAAKPKTREKWQTLCKWHKIQCSGKFLCSHHKIIVIQTNVYVAVIFKMSINGEDSIWYLSNFRQTRRFFISEQLISFLEYREFIFRL
jgi:hypothetical protein